LDAAAKAKANGPAGEVLDWDAVNWRAVEEDVRRLRQRIFTATKAGDLKKVRSLQRLMLRSRSNVLLSVRRVTQDNAGRTTAGVDGEVMTTSYGRARLVEWMLNETEPWQARPVRRVFIPKSNGRRPLGIPVIVDRVFQARVKNALEPEWEARFEPKSYGFRPGRGCHDAIEAIYQVVKGRNPKRLWVLDADLAAAFDRLDHSHLLDQLGAFPGRGMIADWLTAGVIEKDHFTPTEEGVPQGGVISPLLLNIALHGMEAAAGVRYFRRARGTGNIETAPDGPTLVRYADDMVALCHSRRQAEDVKARLAEWLAPRGLAFNEDKTRIVHLADGFNFLGFNVRRYHDKLVLIKPSKQAVRRIRLRLRAEMRALRGSNASAVLKKLAPIVRGWAAYCVSRGHARWDRRAVGSMI
jgi:RNA-directed DNA polymerase